MRSMTKRCDRLRSAGRPFSLQAMVLKPYSQRRLAVARLKPNLQQMSFHGERSARAQTSFASWGSNQVSHGIVCSIRVIESGDGGGLRSLGGPCATRYLNWINL